LFFRPVLIEDDTSALFTGYFEPELNGSRFPTARFKYPLYKMPPEARAQNPWLSRRELLSSGVMDNRGLEIAWVDDPVELFFLQIQGSGRIRLPDDQTLRVGYGGANGQPYRSIGVELVRRGLFDAHQVSADVIKTWVRRNPAAGEELLFHNPSYVFFREVSHVAAEKGPLGAMNRSVTAQRTIAVDPAYVPLGAPVWVEKDGAVPMRRLMVAQDTGSAIKGAQRADIFFGTGDEAGREAGKLRDPGRMMVLLPIQRAYALLPSGAG
jgi:membrane-bound lytic murein transglycosylase A